MLMSKKRCARNPKKAAGNGRYSSLSRPNQEIRPNRSTCYVVSAGSRPSVELPGQSAGHVSRARSPRTVIAFSRSEGYVTGDHLENFSFPSYKEFRDDSIVVLEGAPSVLTSVVTGREVRGDPAFVMLPAYSPESIPVGACYRRLQTSPAIGSSTPSASYQQRLISLLLNPQFRIE